MPNARLMRRVSATAAGPVPRLARIRDSPGKAALSVCGAMFEAARVGLETGQAQFVQDQAGVPRNVPSDHEMYFEFIR